MRPGAWAAIVAASISSSGAAWATCPAGKSRNCVNFDLVPQISQQIVAGEHLAAPPKKLPAAEKTQGYTGPTLGAAPNTRRAPEVGYRWAIN